MTAMDRSTLYRLAVQTALRANELRSLHVDQLQLSATPPFVLVTYGAAKNKQTARQYVTKSLASELRKYIGKRTGKLFQSFPEDWRLVDVIRHDLTAAGISHVDASGQQIDFHALRHTCGTWLAQAGTHPKAIQSIMRHSDIRLTLETYGHLFPSQEAESITKVFS